MSQKHPFTCCSKQKLWGSGERMNKIQKRNNRICQGSGMWKKNSILSYWLEVFTRICVEPHPLTISQTGRLRYGRVSPELTGHRMSAFPCWPWQAHPSERSERKKSEYVADKRNVLGLLVSSPEEDKTIKDGLPVEGMMKASFIKLLYADIQGRMTIFTEQYMAGALWTHLWIFWEDVVNQSLVPGPECPTTTTNTWRRQSKKIKDYKSQ